MSADQMTIGELAKAVGLNVQTLRYYERRKLFGPDTRTEAGYRIYSEKSRRRILFIKSAQDLGFTLSEIHDLLKLGNSRTADCVLVRQKAESKLRDVKNKQAELKKIETNLKSLIGECSSGRQLKACPIFERLEN